MTVARRHGRSAGECVDEMHSLLTFNRVCMRMYVCGSACVACRGCGCVEGTTGAVQGRRCRYHHPTTTTSYLLRRNCGPWNVFEDADSFRVCVAYDAETVVHLRGVEWTARPAAVPESSAAVRRVLATEKASCMQTISCRRAQTQKYVPIENNLNLHNIEAQTNTIATV